MMVDRMLTHTAHARKKLSNENQPERKHSGHRRMVGIEEWSTTAAEKMHFPKEITPHEALNSKTSVAQKNTQSNFDCVSLRLTFDTFYVQAAHVTHARVS